MADNADCVRPLQLSIVEGRECPVGPLLQSVFQGSNADLIAAVAPMYLTGSVLDVTYGRGMWWRRCSPEPFTFHDVALDGVDFRSLPHPDRSFDAVCFDPPYVPRHGNTDATMPRYQDFRERYGLDTSRSWTELRALILEGLAECARVSGRWVLVKCNDFVTGRELELGHVLVLEHARQLGLRPHDLIVHHTGAGPGGYAIRRVLRARRAHSYLVVLRRGRR
jgi:hypothetical protein